MKKIYIILLLTSIFMSCNGNLDKTKLIGADIRLFKNTVAEKVSKAIVKGDTATIIKEINSGVPVNFQDEIYGNSLLMIAILHNNSSSIKCLLKLGADPNLYSDTTKHLGDNPVILSSFLTSSSPEILQLLIDYGGDPNSITRGVKKAYNGDLIPTRMSAIEAASRRSLDKVKILVRSGANFDILDDWESPGALNAALIHDKMDIVLYLLEHGADFTLPYMKYDYTKRPYEKYYVDILFKLRQVFLPLNSENYMNKIKVIEFLKERGLNYKESPIPENIVKRAKKNILTRGKNT